MLLRRRFALPGSLDLEASSGQHLTRTLGTPTDKNKWTLSFWFKRETTGALQYIFHTGTSGNASGVLLTSTDHLAVVDFVASSYATRVSDLASLADTNWHHGCIRYDTDQATASDRIKVYTDGVLATSFEFSTYPGLSYASGFVNAAAAHIIGKDATAAGDYFDGLLAGVAFVDGGSLGPEHFIERRGGFYRPRLFTGSYGANGFFLPFHKGSGEDRSGGGDNWTLVASPVASATRPEIAA